MLSYTFRKLFDTSFVALGVVTLAFGVDWGPADLFEGTPCCEDGCFRIPDRPAHGIALASGADKKYRA